MVSRTEVGGLGPIGQQRLQESRKSIEGNTTIDLTHAEASRGLGTLLGRGRPYEEVKKEIENYEVELERVKAEIRAEAAATSLHQARVTVEDIGGAAIMNF